MTEQIDSGTAKLIIGSLWGAVGVICAAIAFLMRIAFKLGQTSNEIQDTKKDLEDFKGLLKSIPKHETQIDQLQTLYKEIRSDIKELRRQKSNPDFGDHGE